MSEQKNGMNRREFLKVIGAAGGLAAAGCGERLPDKIIPYVIQPDEIIPGIAAWYAGSCAECPAGCGTLMRVREGRVVKVEGNPLHPVNRGGLCALGQSVLQAHYDPDRVREPLKRADGGNYQAVSWEDAVGAVAAAIKSRAEDEPLVLITGETGGSLDDLITEWSSKIPRTKHFVHELINHDAFHAAAFQCFGSDVHFDFSKADVVVSFGADYLETWISPVEFARQWSSRRKPPAEGAGSGWEMSYTVQIEPRMSLTGANADRWVMNAPGTEGALLAALLKLVVEKIGASRVSNDMRKEIQDAVEKTDVTVAAELSGVSRPVLEEIAHRLISAKTSLVLAGGAPLSAAHPVECAVLANLLNAILGNVGKSVLVRSLELRPVRDRAQRFYDFCQDVRAGKQKAGVVIVAGTNPAYSLPRTRAFAEVLAGAKLVVAVSTAFDETAALAQYVLPLSTSLEAWGDAEPAPGVFNLNQPAMQPLYQSQCLGDTLLAIGERNGNSIEGVKNFEAYLKRQWKKRSGENDFENRWLRFVERGGDWPEAGQAGEQRPVFPLASAINVERLFAPGSAAIKLLAFPTVNGYDGRAASRPWMQETPNPQTSAVWGSWVELHDETARRFGVHTGDVVQVVTEQGSVEGPVYVTKFVHPQLVAMPIGGGHDSSGRYAQGVGANVMKIMTADLAQGQLRMMAPLATDSQMKDGQILKPARGAEGTPALVLLQGHDSQEGRNLIRSVSAAALLRPAAPARNGQEEREGDLGPQPKPAQMYEQIEHPLYRWGMTVDLASCTGCSACVVACYAENNVPVVGKSVCAQGREMSWLRIERYLDGSPEKPVSGFMPMMCQQCDNAPCESVCPVYATYHNEEGLNTMVYNRCVGTRYCSNNCPYKVRRFNWFQYKWPEPLNWQLNPDVTVREVGIMEKCTFCVQRISEAKNAAKNEGRTVRDGEITPACAATCPTKAISFGDLNDEKSLVFRQAESRRSYKVLDEAVNTQPAVTYLARVAHEAEKKQG